MAERRHRYAVGLEWTGNRGAGTASYRGYDRAHVLRAPGKPAIAGSSDPQFRGDAGCWNPEELLVGALAACHQLWYLHLCAEAGVILITYEDQAEGVMEETADGAGQFIEVVLRPVVTIAAGSDVAVARRLHDAAHGKCFVARSVNFPVTHAPVVTVAA